ncbi:hypothetical protein COV93_06085 [Candidatus Woesearchaeota archaeon CG11_big_fil_rev_8_21_14_0_20_43_8]|nr:MAG: hypothetical protein COV93_06085 [Candidatus Woesearchaeota archaeon CG11_big_fil_rev_8_21_14_0_20_43_8]
MMAEESEANEESLEQIVDETETTESEESTSEEKSGFYQSMREYYSDETKDEQSKEVAKVLSGDAKDENGKRIWRWMDRMHAVRAMLRKYGDLSKCSEDLLGIVKRNKRFKRNHYAKSLLLERWLNAGLEWRTNDAYAPNSPKVSDPDYETTQYAPEDVVYEVTDDMVIEVVDIEPKRRYSARARVAEPLDSEIIVNDEPVSPEVLESLAELKRYAKKPSEPESYYEDYQELIYPTEESDSDAATNTDVADALAELKSYANRPIKSESYFEEFNPIFSTERTDSKIQFSDSFLEQMAGYNIEPVESITDDIEPVGVVSELISVKHDSKADLLLDKILGGKNETKIVEPQPVFLPQADMSRYDDNWMF